MKILSLLIGFLGTFIYFCSTNSERISESCSRERGEFITCQCNRNEELNLPSHINYEKLKNLTITSCKFVDLHISIVPNAKLLRDIIIQNISGSLKLEEPFLISKKLDSLKLINIQEIPQISHNLLLYISSINTLTIEDTRIEEFDEEFTNIHIERFILRNVSIKQMRGINFSGKGKRLEIINTIIRNITGGFNFAFFESIAIINSTFEFEKPETIPMHGTDALIINCVFLNVSVNLVVNENITIKENCADGQSSMRLWAKYVHSVGNRLPTEMNYTQNITNRSEIYKKNNTVCIAGDCKCPKSPGYNSFYKIQANIYLAIILFIVIHSL